MKKTSRIIIFLLAALTTLTFCFYPEPGFSVGKRKPRIVSLAPSITESLFAMGFGDNVAGVTDYDLYPEEVKRLPKVKRYYDPSLEKILVIKPDLVIGVGTFHSDLLERLENLGIRTLSLVVHERLDDIRTALERIAAELGNPEAAEKTWKNILKELEYVKGTVEKVYRGRPPSVMVVVWHDPLTVAGGYNYIDDILQAIELPNAAGDLRYAFPVIDREGLLVRDPDVLVIASASTGMTFSEKDLETVLKGLPVKALKRGRIATVSADSLFHPGPRVAVAAEELVNVVTGVVGGFEVNEKEKVFD